MQATASEQNVARAVTATQADLLNALGFDQLHANDAGNRIAAHNAKALLVEAPEGEVAGMVFYYTTFAPWAAKSGLCLEGLHVLPGYRCRGYARLLGQSVAKKAQELGCARVEWRCHKRNERALRFYRSVGAKEVDSLTFFWLDGDAMSRFANETS